MGGKQKGLVENTKFPQALFFFSRFSRFLVPKQSFSRSQTEFFSFPNRVWEREKTREKRGAVFIVRWSSV
jgi:hypothetical protein